MLLNLCFHIAMTAAVFAGGITLTGYLIVCQAVGTGRGDGHQALPLPRAALRFAEPSTARFRPAKPRRMVTGGDAARSAGPPPCPFPTISPLLQVGIILHYSSLSTLLWMAVKARVLYKEVTWRAPRQPDGDTSQPAPRPMLRYGHPCPSPWPHGGAESSGGFPCPTSRGRGRACSAVQAHPARSRAVLSQGLAPGVR